MKNLLNLILLLFPCFLIGQESDLKLWYQQPAAKWTEALPLGNGRLGAMIHGRYDHELFQMNEESLWAGSQINNNNPESASHLQIWLKNWQQNIWLVLQLGSDLINHWEI